MVTDVRTRPDYRAYAAEIADGTFVAGVASGRWSIVAEEWPSVIVTLAAAPREGAPDHFEFRLELTNFPADAPTATPWDLSANSVLDPSRRPRGGRADMVFRRDNWADHLALYAPWDRVALAGHDNWRHQHPHLAWHPSRTLVFFFERTMELFNCDGYVGI